MKFINKNQGETIGLFRIGKNHYLLVILFYFFFLNLLMLFLFDLSKEEATIRMQLIFVFANRNTFTWGGIDLRLLHGVCLLLFVFQCIHNQVMSVGAGFQIVQLLRLDFSIDTPVRSNLRLQIAWPELPVTESSLNNHKKPNCIVIDSIFQLNT